jgi:hypothetical protein
LPPTLELQASCRQQRREEVPGSREAVLSPSGGPVLSPADNLLAWFDREAFDPSNRCYQLYLCDHWSTPIRLVLHQQPSAPIAS